MQYRQFARHLLFIGENTPLSVKALFENVESFIEKNILSGLTRVKTERSGDLLGPKDISSLVDDTPRKAASKIRHYQPDLERSDDKFFSRNDSTISKVRSCSSQGSTFTDE